MKSWAPGLTLTYTGPPLTTRAAACRRAAGWREWNMSQSGVARGPRKAELKAHTATCAVGEAGSAGQKSSDARTTEVEVKE